MLKSLFVGNMVRLTAESPELLGQSFSRWDRDSEYTRLLRVSPSQLWSAKKIKEWIEKDLEKDPPEEFFFNIRSLESDQLIGFLGLWAIRWTHGDATVSIGIGEKTYWGKGYGTDAMRLALNYAFTELNLYRVSLYVFSYNTRAIRSYEKADFTVEGRLRGMINREGERVDVLVMGVLRSEWLARRAECNES